MRTSAKFVFSMALSALLCAGAANSATFTVDLAVDDADAHDANPGNGVCADNFGACTLRAAMEEANALAGTDSIHFADGFTNVILYLSASEGPLPVITGRVSIFGSTIDAYNTSATLLRDAPPQFFIDGSNLSASSNNGLLFSGSGASNSVVSAIGIINFPGNGILAAPGADNLVIERNYIGVGANGVPAGNSGNGLHAVGSDGHLVGKALNAAGTAFVGLGNVISSNGLSGVRLESSDDNDLRGNLIGIAPAGTGDRGNGGHGIQVSGTGNTIGAYLVDTSAGNFIAGNNLGGIFSVGNSNRIYANSLGKGETGGFIDSEFDGVVVIGNSNFIGEIGRGKNMIVEHAGYAIRLGVEGGTAASGNSVLNNEIGSAGSQFPILFSGNGAGIIVANGNSNTINNNIVLNSVGNTALSIVAYGMFVRGNSNTISGNQVGFANSISGPLSEPNQFGIQVIGDNNIIGSFESRNQVGGNILDAIGAAGNGNTVRFNYVGVTSTFAEIANGGIGVFVRAGSNVTVQTNYVGHNTLGILLSNITDSMLIGGNYVGITPDGDNIGNFGDGVQLLDSSNVTVQLNRISFNTGNGIATNENASGNYWYQNRMHGNSALGIDLGYDGATPNDAGDVDEGPNRYQNHPVIQQAILDTQAFPPTLTVSYRVDSNSGTASYPLFVDFYWSDMDEPAQGRFVAGTDLGYSSPNALRTFVMNFVDGVPGGWLVATARDQDGNTSEFSARFEFGQPFDLIFADGFD